MYICSLKIQGCERSINLIKCRVRKTCVNVRPEYFYMFSIIRKSLLGPMKSSYLHHLNAQTALIENVYQI